MKGKFTTLKDIYAKYRYKWYDITSTTVPMYPYIPKEEISNHQYKLSKKEWVKLINIYFEVFIDMLMEGDQIRLPHGLGDMRLCKRIITSRNPCIAKENLVYTNSSTMNYALHTLWHRKKAMFRYKHYYKFRIVDSRLHTMYKRIRKNPLMLYNLNNV